MAQKQKRFPDWKSLLVFYQFFNSQFYLNEYVIS